MSQHAVIRTCETRVVEDLVETLNAYSIDTGVGPSDDLISWPGDDLAYTTLELLDCKDYDMTGAPVMSVTLANLTTVRDVSDVIAAAQMVANTAACERENCEQDTNMIDIDKAFARLAQHKLVATVGPNTGKAGCFPWTSVEARAVGKIVRVRMDWDT